MAEKPIFINYGQTLRNQEYPATRATAITRQGTDPREVWLQISSIPDLPSPALVNNGDIDGVVELRIDTLVQQDATTFVSSTSALNNVIPATFGQTNFTGGYQPRLTDTNNKVVPYDASVWVIDGINQILQFPYGVPSGVQPPLTVRVYQYIGLTPVPPVPPPPSTPDISVYVDKSGTQPISGIGVWHTVAPWFLGDVTRYAHAGFNQTTGVFTVPRAGKYSLKANVVWSGPTPGVSVWLQFLVNGTVPAVVAETTTQALDFTQNLSTDILLALNDTVVLQARTDGADQTLNAFFGMSVLSIHLFAVV